MRLASGTHGHNAYATMVKMIFAAIDKYTAFPDVIR